MPSDTPSKNNTLEQLMQAAQAGNQRAYESVLRAISQKLVIYLGRKLPPKDRDDVLQDILLSIHKVRHTYDGKRPLMPWVMAVTNYRVQDFWRRHYGHGFDTMQDIEDLKDVLAAEVGTTIDVHEDIKRVLQSLPSRQQELLDLMYRQDKSVQEVAELLGMKVSAVKTMAHRSYKLLRKKLNAP